MLSTKICLLRLGVSEPIVSKENLPKTCFLRAGNTSKSIFPWCDTPVSESPLSLRPQKVNLPGV